MDNVGYLFGAFALAWLVILSYLGLLSRRQTRIESDLRQLDEAMQFQREM